MSGRVAVSGRISRSTSTWVPTNITGCLLWLRGDLGKTLDINGKVSTWADQSGNGNDATQSTTGSAPVPVTSDTSYNNQATLDFSSGKFMNGATNVGLSGGSRTMLFVAHTTAVTSACLFQNRTTANQTYFQCATVSGATWLVNSDAGWRIQTTPLATLSNPSVFTFFLNGTGNTPGFEQSGRAPSITSAGGGQTAETGTTGYLLGKQSGGIPWSGKIAEIIAYDSALSATNRRVLYKYLTDRYLIPIYMPTG